MCGGDAVFCQITLTTCLELKHMPSYFISFSQILVILRKSLHVDEVISIYQNTNMNASNMSTTSIQFTYGSLHIWQRESVRALQVIRTVGFLQKLMTSRNTALYRITDITILLEMVYYRGAFLNTAYRYADIIRHVVYTIIQQQQFIT